MSVRENMLMLFSLPLQPKFNDVTKATTMYDRNNPRTDSEKNERSSDSDIDRNSTNQFGQKKKRSMKNKSRLERSIRETLIVSTIMVGSLELANFLLRDRGIWLSCLEAQEGPFAAARYCESTSTNTNEGSFLIESSNSRSNYMYMICGTFCALLSWCDVDRNKSNDSGSHRERRQQQRRRQKNDHAQDRVSISSTTETARTGSTTSLGFSFTRTSIVSSCVMKEIEDEAIVSSSEKMVLPSSTVAEKISPPDPEDEAILVMMEEGGRDERENSSADGSYLYDNLLLRSPIVGISFGLAMVVLGYGSFFFHASQCRKPNRWDTAAMFSVCIWPALYCLLSLNYNTTDNGAVPIIRQGKNDDHDKKKEPPSEEVQQPSRREQRSGCFYVPIIQLLIFLAKLIHGYEYVDQTIHFDAIVTSVFLGMSCFLLLITICAKRRRMGRSFNYYILASSLGTLGAGIFLRQLDSNGVLCDRNLPISGHAWWHVLTALAGILLYFFLRSERIMGTDDDSDNAAGRPRTDTEDTKETVVEAVEVKIVAEHD